MWTRAELKKRAKNVLKASYWKAFLVSIVLSFAGRGSQVGFNFNAGNLNLRGNRGSSYGNYHINSFGNSFVNPFDNPKVIAILIGVLIVVLIIMLAAIAFRIFVGYPLEIGGLRYFVQSAQGNVDLNTLGFAFNRMKYLDIIKAMLWRALLNFLWYLLLFIPGIIKAFAYSMVPYILADNPNIGYRRALELSNKMTDGHKFGIFVLGLSFIGWYLLGIMAFFIGVIFVVPYQYATNAELYLTLRTNALEYGLCSYEELNLSRPESESAN